MANALDLTGRIIGEYEICGRLGLGGMGAVYEGRHPVIGKRVAVKVLLPALSETQPVVERFIDEARAVNAIGHRGIVDIFAFGKLPEGSVYFVMEYLDGLPLDKVIRTLAPLQLTEALGYMEEVCDALSAAHSVGIIHRDIKPSNIFVVRTPRGPSYVKLLDFGIAKLNASANEESPQTLVGQALGTPDYMAPEQARGQPISCATDLYSVGCVLFELLTGRRVFKGPNAQRTMLMHAEDSPGPPSSLRPDVPVELDNLVLWMLEKRAEDRPRSASEVRAHCAALREKLAPPPTPSPSAAAVTPIPPRRSAPVPAPASMAPSTNSPTAALRPARAPEPINVALGGDAARSAAAAADFAELKAGRMVVLARPGELDEDNVPTKMVPMLDPVLTPLRRPIPPPLPWVGTDKLLNPEPAEPGQARSSMTPRADTHESRKPREHRNASSSSMVPAKQAKTPAPLESSQPGDSAAAQTTGTSVRTGSVVMKSVAPLDATDFERTAPGLPPEAPRSKAEPAGLDIRPPVHRQPRQQSYAAVAIGAAVFLGVAWFIARPSEPPQPPTKVEPVPMAHVEPEHLATRDSGPLSPSPPEHAEPKKSEPPAKAGQTKGPAVAQRIARCEAFLLKREARLGVDPVLRGFLAQVRSEAASADTDAKRRELARHLNELQQQLTE